MTWVIVQEGRILYRGSREECMATAERFGLLFHVGSELDDAGEPRGVLVDGRHWHPDGTELPISDLQQPKAEAEIALILKHDIDQPDITQAELIRAVDHVLPAIEIVGSRISNWDIRISDTIADNASSGLYVLGGPARALTNVDLAETSMVLKRNGRPASYGAGIACLGHPLNAAVWLARTCAQRGEGLKAGDVVLTGALGPMVEIAAGDAFEATISGLGSVRFTVSTN